MSSLDVRHGERRDNNLAQIFERKESTKHNNFILKRFNMFLVKDYKGAGSFW